MSHGPNEVFMEWFRNAYKLRSSTGNAQDDLQLAAGDAFEAGWIACVLSMAPMNSTLDAEDLAREAEEQRRALGGGS